MKLFWAILLASLAALNARATDNIASIEANNVVITTGLINRLVAEARTNNPSLRAADSRVRSARLNADPSFARGHLTT